MKKCFPITTLILGFTLAFAPVTYAQVVGPDTEVDTQKRAQTGMKFLSNSLDARATSLGGAVSAEMYGSSVSMFYNPASMAGMQTNFHAAAGVTQFIADINYNMLSFAYKPKVGNYGVFGVSLVSVDYGDIIGTIRADNDDGFVETGTFSPTALAVGVGYARAFTDRFQAGVHVKYALQDLGEGFITETGTGGLVSSAGELGGATTEDYSVNTLAFDFGVVYHTGYRSLVIAMSARNFAQELSYVRDNFELPLTFQIGAAFNLVDLTSMNSDTHSLALKVDAQRPRDFTEHVKVGLEYTFMDIFSLRGGMAQLGAPSDEEQGINLGAGLKYSMNNLSFGADYAYTDFGVFDNVNRISLQIGF